MLWQGRARFSGLVAVAVAAVIWQQTTRPAVLVDDSGVLIGVMGTEGRALSKPTGAGFVAGIWLENDGAPVPQDQAAARAGLQRDGRMVAASLGDWQIVQLSGKTVLADVQGCGGADVLISNQVDAGLRPCAVFDLRALRKTGALALDLTDTGDLIITTAHSVAGQRPWNSGQGPVEPPLRLSLLEKRAATMALISHADQ